MEAQLKALETQQLMEAQLKAAETQQIMEAQLKAAETQQLMEAQLKALETQQRRTESPLGTMQQINEAKHEPVIQRGEDLDVILFTYEFNYNIS